MRTLELHDVRPDEGDYVPGLACGQNKLVLAQDSSGEDAEDGFRLGLHHFPRQGGSSLTGGTGITHAVLELLSRRLSQV